MIRDTLRDFSGRIIGYIETDEKNGNKVARDFYQRIVGYYDKNLNVTKDFYQRIVGRGEVLSSLIYKAEEEYQQKLKGNK